MQTTYSPPRPLETQRSSSLRGTVRVPGDPTLTLLAMASAALTPKVSFVEDAFRGPEAALLAAALGELGVRTALENGVWRVEGMGVGGLLAPRRPLQAGSSRLVAALLMGLCGACDFPAEIVGQPGLADFDTLFDGLTRMGCAVSSANGRLPVQLHGPRVALPATLELGSADLATKAALLIAALHSPATSRLVETETLPNHAERMLTAFGASIKVTPRETGGQSIETGGVPTLRARRLAIPGDPSLAAICAVAATIVPGSDLRIANVVVNPTRTLFLSALVAMGASVEAHELRIADGEEVADLVVRHQTLNGVALGAGHVAGLLAELPYLAIAAACAEGDTVLHLPEGLPAEAATRISATARGLGANGVFCETRSTALSISGIGEVRGRGRVLTGKDPVVGMAFLVLGMAAREQVTIDDQNGIEERFPGFVELFESVGASFVRLT